MATFFHNTKLVSGVILLAISTLPLFLRNELKGATTLTLGYGAYYIGITYISDYIAVKYGGHSLFGAIFGSRKNKIIYF